MPNRTVILSAAQIDKKIERMAHHIFENHFKDKELHVVGIVEHGYTMAQRISEILKQISTIDIHTYSMKLNKKNPLAPPVFSGELNALEGKVVLLVDDVLKSGRTLIHASRYILEKDPQNLATVTLVDRIHRRFPIRADYVGLSLSTNLKEHITVDLSKGKEVAYLE